ncbi:protein kinase [Streptomyces sp. NPDC087908]|uniref:protein kinase domain-containing protein n=1 Tax=unclassified Streptomyces TaxID=2593676 RepID=UPI0011CD7391|nr:protein kinase [Streptomyces sp. adm13(2018)]TXS11095.1 protein kinase [Streptomyces sp. adm13(2018)]
MSPEGPYEPPEGALLLLDPGHRQLVLNRRGSTVWKVTTDLGPYAVKVGHPTRAHAWTALAPAREAAILRQLTHERIFSGEWEHGTWAAQPWRRGDSLHDRWASCRSGEAEPDLGEALSCALALSALHGRGWAHGDVQPAHFLLGEPGGASLIDLGLSSGGPVPRVYDFPYRGCLVHYEAPEISAGVLGSGTVTPTREADVYALGAALFISATGWRHVAYPDDASREEQRRAIVAGPHRPVRVPGPLGPLIRHMLSPSAADRPTAAEVCDRLSAVV